jgi:ABC-type transport system substrate-binding protein
MPLVTLLRNASSRLIALALLSVLMAGCNNSPYATGAEKQNTLFDSFQERSPRYLDPTASYSANEAQYTYLIYEPLYGYHYLKRPYEVIPKAADAVAQPYYLDAQGKRLPNDAAPEQIAESVYEIHIHPGILYAPHPAFAKNERGEYLYHHLTREQLGSKHTPFDFAQQGTRELVADDYVYALKRQATTRIEAPAFATFSEYVIGLKEYGKRIKEEDAKLLHGLSRAARDKPFLDFRQWPLEGVTALDKHTLRIRLKGRYPQWNYWMTMTFTAPVPWEVDAFYAQTGMADNGLSWNQWPVGTGPFMMVEYQQDRRHVLKRNPNFRGLPYPCEGAPGDREKGLLDDCGKTMPFYDTIVDTFEKERTPIKEKFKQGFLDVPEIWRPEWGIDFRVDMEDSDEVRKLYDSRGFQFPVTTDINNWYLGFNWLDPVVGKGDTPEQQVKNRKLRQALSIAVDWEEGYGRIFRNKGGEAAEGPVPPGVFGSRHGTVEGMNPVTHKLVDGKIVRRSIDEAKRLLAEAGYPDGRDAKTGRPLVLNYDYQRTPTPELKTELDWMVKQFAKLGVQLEIRATDYNQFQEKMLQGKQQIFWWGWLADYPDAENFLFLLYGPNGKAKHQGENAANYENPEFDRLYRQMQALDNGPEKQKLIDQMVAIAQQDSPWAWGYFPYVGVAFQSWVHNGKPTVLVNDRALYYRVDPVLRAQRQAEWNNPVWWPLVGLLVLALALAWIGRRGYVARERVTAKPTARPGAAAA